MLFENILLSIIKNRKQKTIFYSETCFLVFFFRIENCFREQLSNKSFMSPFNFLFSFLLTY